MMHPGTGRYNETPLIPTIPEFLRDLGFRVTTRLESHWTEVDGVRMHSRRSKNPPPNQPAIVLIHGLVISSLYMIPLAECLAIRHSVFALDLPGFGRSASPERVLSVAELGDAVIAWMNACGIARCHLVGNSLGCEIAAHAAVRAPERIGALTLIGPTLDPDAYAVVTQTLRLIRDAMREPFRLWLNWIFDFLRAGLPRAIGTTRAMFRDHIEQQLEQIMVPTLVIRGGLDPTVPQSAAETMHRLLRRGTLEVIPHEPHCVHYTAPRIVTRLIEAHTAATS